MDNYYRNGPGSSMSKKKVLLMGKSGSGKTSMRSIIFANYLARDTTRLSPTLDVEHSHVRFLGNLVLNLWDCGGQDAFYESYFDRQRDVIFRGVEVLIYVFDIESNEIEKDLMQYEGVLEALEQNSPDAQVFVLVHKMDLIEESQRDAVFAMREALITQRSATTMAAVQAERGIAIDERQGQFNAAGDDMNNFSNSLASVGVGDMANGSGEYGTGQAGMGPTPGDIGSTDAMGAVAAGGAGAGVNGGGRSGGGGLRVRCFPTSIWDETLYRAWSSIVYTLVPNVEQVEEQLHSLCSLCSADEIVLFEKATFLVISHATQKEHGDVHRYEKISNIIKQFKLSCSKAQASLMGLVVRNSHFSAHIEAFTENTYVMVIVGGGTDGNSNSNSNALVAAKDGGGDGQGGGGRSYEVEPASIQLNIDLARQHFQHSVAFLNH